MRQLKYLFPLIALCLLLGTGRANAQWTVIDPSNIAQSIVNSSKSLVQESTTAQNMINNFKEDGQDLPAGKEILRCPAIGEQPRPRRPKGAADSPDARRHIRLLRQQLQEDADRPQFHEFRTIGHSLRLHPHPRRSQRRAGRLEAGGQHHDAQYDDKDRMDIVDSCHKEMKRLKNLTAYYTNKNISVSYLRAKKKADTQRVVNLYGDGSEKYW